MTVTAADLATIRDRERTSAIGEVVQFVFTQPMLINRDVLIGVLDEMARDREFIPSVTAEPGPPWDGDENDYTEGQGVIEPGLPPDSPTVEGDEEYADVLRRQGIA